MLLADVSGHGQVLVVKGRCWLLQAGAGCERQVLAWQREVSTQL